MLVLLLCRKDMSQKDPRLCQSASRAASDRAPGRVGGMYGRIPAVNLGSLLKVLLALLQFAACPVVTPYRVP